ncbi:MAG TPA: phosphoglycerate mutase family protein [Gillisia sp.]|nr:phosphoglycerate mutase family protein [Gillisia sp.]
MKKILLLIGFMMIACNYNTSANSDNLTEMEIPQKPTVYYFIRHAEKDTSNPVDKDPELTEEGIKRSEKWAKVFNDISFDVIYSTDYKRTRSTAKTVADSQDKEVIIYNATKLNDETFKANTKGKTVLVVGHSNTNPAFVNYILEEKRYSDIPETESGSLFIVTVYPGGEKHSQVLYFN